MVGIFLKVEEGGGWEALSMIEMIDLWGLGVL
jgi:hypothetical protein